MDNWQKFLLGMAAYNVAKRHVMDNALDNAIQKEQLEQKERLEQIKLQQEERRIQARNDALTLEQQAYDQSRQHIPYDQRVSHNSKKLSLRKKKKGI